MFVGISGILDVSTSRMPADDKLRRFSPRFSSYGTAS